VTPWGEKRKQERGAGDLIGKPATEGEFLLKRENGGKEKGLVRVKKVRAGGRAQRFEPRVAKSGGREKGRYQRALGCGEKNHERGKDFKKKE